MPMKLLKKKNYQAMVMNLVRGGGTWLFKNLFAKLDDGTEVDLLDNGRLACAVSISGVLLLNNELISGMHATVDSTEKDMLKNGWVDIDAGKDWLNIAWRDIRPLLKGKIGAVIIWEKQTDKDGAEHRHIGFYADDDFAISNDPATHRMPMKHHITFGIPGAKGFRRIERIYWHPSLDVE